MSQHIQDRSGGEANQGQSNNRENFTKDRKGPSEVGIAAEQHGHENPAEAFAKDRGTAQEEYKTLEEKLHSQIPEPE